MGSMLSDGADHEVGRRGGAYFFQMEEVAVVTEVLKRTSLRWSFHTPPENQGTRLICTSKI